MANTPNGVRSTTKRVTRHHRLLERAQVASKRLLVRRTPISATPSAVLNSTTAGTIGVGERVERVGRDEQVGERERLSRLDQRVAEERCAHQRRKGERHDGDDAEREHAEDDQQQPQRAQRQPARRGMRRAGPGRRSASAPGTAAPSSASGGCRCRRAAAAPPAALAEEQPHQHAQREADQDARRQAPPARPRERGRRVPRAAPRSCARPAGGVGAPPELPPGRHRDDEPHQHQRDVDPRELRHSDSAAPSCPT